MTEHAERPASPAAGPLAGTFAVQTVTSMAMFGVAVIAPVAAPAIGVEAELIGAFTAIAYAVGMPAGLMTGAFIERYGGIRVCQLTMVFVLLGVGALTLSVPLAAAASAVLLGLSYGPVNPASTHILARVGTPRWRPLIFSIKQTGMPAGAGLAGALLPLLILAFDWRVAILATGLVAVAVAIGVQALRPEIDDDRNPARRIRLGSVAAPLKLIGDHPPLRCIAVLGFAYSGSLVTITTFYVIHLTSALDLSLGAAGLIYTLLQASAILGRLFWGGVADQLIAGERVLAGLGFATAVFAVVAGLFDASWPFWAVCAVTVLLGVTSHSYNGVFFSELAKRAPPGRTGDAAGGAQFASLAGVSAMPPVFGLIVTLTGDYLWAYCLVAAASAAAAGYAWIALHGAASRSD